MVLTLVWQKGWWGNISSIGIKFIININEWTSEGYGWYPVYDDASSVSFNNGIADSIKTLYASLEALPERK